MSFTRQGLLFESDGESLLLRLLKSVFMRLMLVLPPASLKVLQTVPADF